MTYQERFLKRCRHDGLDPTQAKNKGERKPASIVLHPDYVSPVSRASGKFGHFNNILMAHEKEAIKFMRPLQERPKKFFVEKTKKYDHYKMNYAGWNFENRREFR